MIRETTDLTGGLPISREYFYAERPAQPEIRDALNVWLEEETGAFGMRVGFEANSTDWATPEIYLDIAFPDGRVVSRRTREVKHGEMDENGNPTIGGAGPLRFTCIEPFRRWKMEFRGTAPVVSADDLVATPYPQERAPCDVAFSIELIMAVPPWIMGTLASEAGDALENSDQGDYMSPRYEQLCRARGSMTIDGMTSNFKGQALRIRRQGFRKFEGFWGHCWASALMPSGKAFGYNVFPPREDGQPSYSEGYIFDGDGELRSAQPSEIPWLKELIVRGERADSELTAGDDTFDIEGTAFIATRARYSTQLPPDFPADFPVIQQSHVMYTWDGERATGMMERSTPPSQMHIYHDWRE